jgi:hypothetical protein
VSKHKHITEPSSAGFQVRIVRDRKEHSRYFAHKLWGSKAKSLKGAINWRDQTLVLIGDKKPTPVGKKSTGIVGVTRTVQFCKGVHALVYSCHWRRNNKGHTKAFQVGVVHKVTADQEFHAFRTAVQFRKEYEFFKDTGKEHLFSPEKYKLWRTEKMYGLSTLEPSITSL